jgi:predicted nucleic acid-binding protein
MSAEFVDTNVLVYFAEQHETKYRRSAELLAQRPIASVQVLNEFANVARRKLRLDWHQTQEVLLLLRSLLDVRPLTVEVHELGLLLAARYDLHIYDAMIAAAALLADCYTLYSEDMHDGLLVAGRLRITNPFG